MIFFIACILLYVWRTGLVNDPEEKEGPSARLVLAPRIVITTVSAIGLVCLALIARTLRNYGHDSSERHRRCRDDRNLDVERGLVRERGGERRPHAATRTPTPTHTPAQVQGVVAVLAQTMRVGNALGLGLGFGLVQVASRDSVQEIGFSVDAVVESANGKGGGGEKRSKE
jgi:hypothetical protein